ncbi:hypothetical protein GmRootV15_27110 [Variovorax sp. V15]
MADSGASPLQDKISSLPTVSFEGFARVFAAAYEANLNSRSGQGHAISEALHAAHVAVREWQRAYG